MNAIISTWKERLWPVYAIAGLLSVILSVWISGRELVINPDGICYLMSADALQVFSVSQVMHLCAQAGWPFYSWLIHAVMMVTGASSLVAANSLNALFDLITVLTFMKLIEFLGGSKRLLIFGAFIILFGHEFNSARQYIIRDHGYWAFYLLSVLFFVRTLTQFSYLNALAWCISLVFATLFRIEGAVFFILLPFAVFFAPRVDARFRLFLNLMLPCFMGLAAAMLISLLYPNELMQSGRLHELAQYLLTSGSQMIAHFHDAKIALMTHVLPLEAARDAGTAWFFTLVFLYTTNILQNLSWVGAILLGYAWVSRAATWQGNQRAAVWAHVVINFIITSVFFAEHLFLSKRYLIAMTLTLFLWLPFALNQLAKTCLEKWQRFAYVFALFLIVLSSMGVILNRGPSKAYVREAGDWLAVNIPKEASLFVNDGQLMYYARHDGLDMFLKLHTMNDPSALSEGQWRHYEYIALRVRGDDTRWSAAAVAMNKEPVRTYSGPHGDTILIYKTGL